jgi:hypothetical protein
MEKTSKKIGKKTEKAKRIKRNKQKQNNVKTKIRKA